ncbi:MAG: trimethylamine methyltransferase family protein, partial [Pseudomonadota bacterium]
MESSNPHKNLQVPPPAHGGGSGRTRRRSRRRNHRINTAHHPAPLIGRNIPAYELCTQSQLVELEQQADWLLENIGMQFRGDTTALDLFAAHGAKVNGETVTFEAGLARSMCSPTPASFTLHSRHPHHSVTVGGDHVVLMPGYGSPFVTDIVKGRRYATLKDFENFVKLTYASPYLHHSGGTVVEPVDIPVSKRHLDMTYTHLMFSDKPFMGAVTSVDRARDSIAMAKIVFGNDYLDNHTVMQANININSPFVFDNTMSESLRVYAEANQCVCVSPAIFSGAMGPVTPAAIAAQTLAEAMAGIALVQLVKPGCATVMGSFHSTMNLRSGALTFGTPEASLVTMALSQLGRRLGVPVRSGGGQITAANSADAQAMTDSSNAMWSTLLSGAQQVWHAAGWLEGGLTMSYEKFVLDLDNCGAMLRLLQGMPVTTDTLTRESYLEAGAGENFLSTSHTMAHYATANYESILPDTG